MVDFQDNAILNEEVFSKLLPQEKIEEITAHTNDTLVMLLNSLWIKATRQEDGNFLITVKEHNQSKQTRKAIFEEIKGLQSQQTQTDPDKLEKIWAMISAWIDNLLNALDSLNPLSPTQAFAWDLDFMEEDLKKDQEELEKLEEEKKSVKEEKKNVEELLFKVKSINKVVKSFEDKLQSNKFKLSNQDYNDLINWKKFVIENQMKIIESMKKRELDWSWFEITTNWIIESIDKILSTYKK